jgi:hypothetical protein
MKSYFAKLADRATLANVPAPSPVYAPRVTDPFADAPSEQAQLPPQKSQQRVAPRDPDGFALNPSQAIPSVEPQRTVVESREHEGVERPSEISTLQPKTPEQTQSHRSEEQEDGSSESRTEESHEQVVNSEVREVVTLLPNKTDETQSIATKEATGKDDVLAQDRQSSIDLETEQTLLLRKADLFMSNLLDSRREPATRDEEESSEPTPQSFKRLESEPTSRLEPAPRNSPAPIQDSTGPSLVIGKLTIEVSPPSPPPVASQPQRLIVRGSRGFGRGVMSSRRFGLGQF